MMANPKAVIDEFCTICEAVSTDYDLYVSLFERDQQTLDLFTKTAPKCFTDLNRILIDHLILQFSKISDPANTGENANLTTNYILKEITWPQDVGEKLGEVNRRLETFHDYIKAARNKRVAHTDFGAQVEQLEALGAFPKGADNQFLRDLQEFVNVAYGHFNGGARRSIDGSMSTDTHQLIRALQKSVIFDRCSKCDGDEKALAVLNFEDSSE